MSIVSKRLVSIAASTLVLSLVSASANAQSDVLTGGGNAIDIGDGVATATYRFTGSMILNSIGFVTNGYTPQSLSYSIGGTTYTLGTNEIARLYSGTSGIQWLDITPQSMVINDVVTVSTKGHLERGTFPFDPDRTITYGFTGFTPNVSANVSYEGLVSSHFDPSYALVYTNSNIKVSNPGSSVAPEPGSFALALTGGAALLGICVRRRRNAG